MIFRMGTGITGGVEMSNNSKIDRARRNALKAASLALGVVVATGITNKRAAAKDKDKDDGMCFVRGTPVLTRDGYRPIESLTAGTEVAVRFAGFAPIRAIDSFTLSRVAGAWTGPSRPVCVKRGALGDNVPAADLCLTASHALFVDGLLVPVGNLVNGTSIVFETAPGQDTLDFFHVELAQHDVLDAAGAPCESLRPPAVEPCVPVVGFNGGRDEIGSRLRSAASLIVDRRRPIDVIRDGLEERGLALALAA
jgi:hypothetical protein